MMEHPVSVSQWFLLALRWIATSYSSVTAFAMPFFSKRTVSRRVSCGTSPYIPGRAPYYQMSERERLYVRTGAASLRALS
jgi:hypothetical protein